MTFPGNQPTLPNQPLTSGKRPLTWLSRWWKAGPWHKAAVFATIPVLLVCTCCSAGLILAATPYGQQLARESAATETVQAANAAQATAAARQYALLHPTPTKAPTDTPLPTETSSPTSAPQPTATATPAPQVTHYPPTTHADLQWLAARGNASAIKVYQSDTVGLVGVCPQPRVEVIVDPSVTGQRLAEDLLAYFYGSQSNGLSLYNPCGSLVLAYNHQSEAGDIYTAGRVVLDVYDSSGQGNVDPNATNLTYTLTLDIGGALTGQEYVITYS